MYKEILTGIGGIHVFPVISLVLFVAVFTVMLVRVVMMDRTRAEQVAALPFEDGAAASARTVAEGGR